MKKFLLSAVIFIVLLGTSITASAEIPDTSYYDIQQATFSIALIVIDEDPETTNHYERVMLARQVLSSPGNISLKMAQIAEANLWTTVTWEGLPRTVIRNHINGIWNYVAIATYGADPVAPE